MFVDTTIILYTTIFALDIAYKCIILYIYIKYAPIWLYFVHIVSACFRRCVLEFFSLQYKVYCRFLFLILKAIFERSTSMTWLMKL